MPRRPLFLLMAATVAITGLSAGPSLAQSRDPSDPWERVNRRFFAVQQGLDRKIFGPLARGYGGIVPGFVRKGIGNFAQNLTEPLVMVNDLLQGHPGRAASTLGRFAINSTFGVAGVVDVAQKGRIPHHDNGFGLTLGRWGMKPGPYIFLPLLGPSTLRDSVGDGADIGLNPLNYVSYRNKAVIGAVVVVAQGLDTRVNAARDLETINETSTDPYATLRSYYLQNRAAEVAEKPVEIQTLPDFDESEPSAAPPLAPPPAEPPAEPPPKAIPNLSANLLVWPDAPIATWPAEASAGQ